MTEFAVSGDAVADDQRRRLQQSRVDVGEVVELAVGKVFPVVVVDHLVVGRGGRGHHRVHAVGELGAALAVLDPVHHVPDVLLPAEDVVLLDPGRHALRTDGCRRQHREHENACAACGESK